MVQFIFPLPGDRRIDAKAELGLLLVMILAGALLFWLEYQKTEDRRSLLRAHFEDQVTQAEAVLSGEIHHLELLAHASLAELSGAPQPKRWDRYVQRLNLDQHYPYLRGWFYLAARTEGALEVLAVAPSGPLGASVGTSLELSPAAQKARIEALQSEELRIGPIEPSGLLAGSPLGFWVFKAHYGPQGRLGLLGGWVDLTDLMEAALGAINAAVHLKLTDGRGPVAKNNTLAEAELDFLVSRRAVVFPGQRWELEFLAGPGFNATHRSILGDQTRSYLLGVVVLLFGWVVLRLLMYSRSVVLRRQRQLSQTVSSKNRFFSLIAHDLKSPFNSLLTMSNLLMHQGDSLNPAEAQKLHQSLYHTASLAYTLLNNLIQWGRRQEGALVAERENLNLGELVEENLQLLSASAERKQLELVNAVPETLHALGDRNMVLSVLRNLLSNAVKFTGKGGKVTVGFKLHEGQVWLFVEDNGLGMDAARLGVLRRGHSAGSQPGTENEVGTGLGLLLCREFVEMMDGQLEIDSQLGEGSRFAFSLHQAE